MVRRGVIFRGVPLGSVRGPVACSAVLHEVPPAKKPPPGPTLDNLLWAGGNVTYVSSDAASTIQFQTLENAINTGHFVSRGFAQARTARHSPDTENIIFLLAARINSLGDCTQSPSSSWHTSHPGRSLGINLL